MKKSNIFTLIFAVVFTFTFSYAHHANAIGEANIKGGPLQGDDLTFTPPDADQLNEDHTADQQWITKWYGPDGNYENSGGFNTTGPIDLMSEGTGGKITDVSLSTLEGLFLTQEFDVEWSADNGGTRGWGVFEIDPADGNNMVRGGPADNFDTYAIIVIDSPEERSTILSPTHDDFAQIWINGEKWYNNSRWTGGVYTVDFNIEVTFQKGANVLLYRCGEGGGSAYLNLHFDDATNDAVTVYPKDATDQASFFDEIAPLTAVEPAGKVTTIWADIKRK
ncbi:hypothetical protein JT359_19790 [Candidatus Poribacteria bacterium]|nr:hypothetical protein [Candidatus Poribacteria bacterium]